MIRSNIFRIQYLVNMSIQVINIHLDTFFIHGDKGHPRYNIISLSGNLHLLFKASNKNVLKCTFSGNTERFHIK
jgi:hypothetical protein